MGGLTRRTGDRGIAVKYTTSQGGSGSISLRHKTLRIRMTWSWALPIFKVLEAICLPTPPPAVMKATRIMTTLNLRVRAVTFYRSETRGWVGRCCGCHSRVHSWLKCTSETSGDDFHCWSWIPTACWHRVCFTPWLLGVSGGGVILSWSWSCGLEIGAGKADHKGSTLNSNRPFATRMEAVSRKPGYMKNIGMDWTVLTLWKLIGGPDNNVHIRLIDMEPVGAVELCRCLSLIESQRIG